jgi:hypothetical protein
MDGENWDRIVCWGGKLGEVHTDTMAQKPMIKAAQPVLRLSREQRISESALGHGSQACDRDFSSHTDKVTSVDERCSLEKSVDIAKPGAGRSS